MNAFLRYTKKAQSISKMATSATILLPGDEIPASALPKHPNQKKPLTLGPGLRHIPPNTLSTTIAGALVTDNKKNAAWVEYNSGRVCITLSNPSQKPKLIFLPLNPIEICDTALMPSVYKLTLNFIVPSFCRRPSNSYRQYLYRRELQLLHHAQHPPRSPPSPRLRRRHPQDPPSTFH